MRVSGSFPSLVGGVSQQVSSLRLANQAADIENAVLSLVSGAKKRPPILPMDTLFQTLYGLTVTGAEPVYHWITSDENIRFLVVLHSSGIRAYSLTNYSAGVSGGIPGSAETVNVVGDGTYVTGGTWDPNNFKLLTIADTTFILNTSKVPALAATLSTAQVHEAWIWVKSAVLNYTFTVTVDGTAYSYKQTSGTPETSGVATQLRTLINAGKSATHTVTLNNNFIYIKRINGADFTVEATDSYNGTSISVVKESVSLLSDLPSEAPNNFTVKVAGSSTDNTDDYYLKFVTESATTFGRGKWVEIVKPGVKYTFTGSTMPHTLERRSDGHFYFDVAAWVNRAAGDDTTNPPPSFVGHPIVDMFLFKDRLGLLSQDKVFLGTSGDYLNLWKNTVVSEQSDAPIDTPVPGAGTSLLQWAVPFNQSLLLFSKDHQFILKGEDNLTNRTVNITMTTAYEGSPYCRPVSSGSSLFFVSQTGTHVGVWEYFVDETTGTNGAAQINAHCPTYIEGTARALSSSTNSEMLLVNTQSDVLHIYQWKWAGDQKAQSAWSKWSFCSSDIVASTIIDAEVWVVLKWSDNKRVLSKLTLGVDPYTESTSDIDAYVGPESDQPPCVDLMSPIATWAGTTSLAGVTTYWFDLPAYLVSPSSLSPSLYFKRDKVCDLVGRGTLTNSATGWTLSTRTATDPWIAAVGSQAGHNGAYYQVGISKRPVAGVATQLTRSDIFPDDPTDAKSNFYWGYPYNLSFTFSTPFITDQTQAGKSSVEDGVLKLQTLRLRYSNSADFIATVTSREDSVSGNVVPYVYTHALPALLKESGVMTIPVRGRAERAVITVSSLSVFPTFLVSAQWEGTWLPQSRRF